MLVNKNSEITVGALSQHSEQTNQVYNVLRRSNRKRHTISSPPTFPKKSSYTSVSSAPSVPPASLITLPHLVTRKLLLYLDVDSLENLSSTCSYFDQFISGRYLTSMDFPLPLDLIKEVASTSRLEKKPLLKIRCKKTEKLLFPSISAIDYIFHFQLSLLSLDKVREFDFVPAGIGKKGKIQLSVPGMILNYEDYDLRLLRSVSRLFYQV